MMNASSCQAASLIVGSDKSFILIRRLLTCKSSGWKRNRSKLEGKWRGQGTVCRYKTVSPLNDHIITWIAEEFIIWENERCDLNLGSGISIVCTQPVSLCRFDFSP